MCVASDVRRVCPGVCVRNDNDAVFFAGEFEMAVTRVCCMGVVANEALCRCCCCCRLKRPPPPPPPPPPPSPPRTVLKLKVFSSFASICSPLDRKNPCRAASAAGTRSSSSSPSSPFISRSKFMPLVLKKLFFKSSFSFKKKIGVAFKGVRIFITIFDTL